MKYIIVTIIILSICCCKANSPRGEIEVVFSPGIVESYIIEKDIIKTVKKTNSIREISSSDYLFLQNIFYGLDTETVSDAISPYIFIRFKSILYIIGNNRVIRTREKTYSITERDYYRIKCIIHFYDFIDKENLENLQEIRRFGIPTDYQYKAPDPLSPPDPFVKIVLQRQ